MRPTHSTRIRFPGLAVLAAALLCLLSTRASAIILQGQFTAHDPSRIIRCEGRYYVYSTGANIQMRYSDDLVHWCNGPSVLAASDSVNGVPQWARDASPGNTGNVVWAPDVIYMNGLYHLYWSFSTFGSADSVIGLHTSPTLDPANPAYKWTDRGPVIASKAGTTGVPNCIDPAPVLDASGNLWLAFGSYNRYGIGITRLDNATGLRLSPASPVTRLAGTSIEAPYIQYRNGFYYLFINRGTCCSGTNSTYHILMGRSTSITGPYRDRAGLNLLDGTREGGGSLFLGTHGNLVGPGHMGVFSEGGIDRFTFHLEADGTNDNLATLNLRTVVWDADGWPAAGAERANGTYRIVSKATGLSVSVRGDSTADGALLEQRAFTDSGFQKWTVAATPGGTPQTGLDGYHRMTSIATNKVMDLFYCRPENGTAVDQYPWFDNDCQRWLVEQTSDGWFRIVSKGGKGVLNAPAGGEGTALNEWAWDGSDAQKWSFIPVEAAPSLTIDDVSGSEGASGETPFTFTLSLSSPAIAPVTVRVRTVDDTATSEDGDYTPLPPSDIVIPAGGKTAAVPVAVNGDGTYERDDRFRVLILEAVNAVIADNEGAGTILNDDPLPTLSVEDAAAAEGAAGITFLVRRDGSTALPSTVFYRTHDGTATAGEDYVNVDSAAITLLPQDQTASFTVLLLDDSDTATDEAFTIELFGPSDAGLSDATGVGQIRDDDQAPYSLDDVAAALRIASGLGGASTAEIMRLNVHEPALLVVSFEDAAAIMRLLVSLDAAPVTRKD